MDSGFQFILVPDPLSAKRPDFTSGFPNNNNNNNSNNNDDNNNNNNNNSNNNNDNNNNNNNNNNKYKVNQYNIIRCPWGLFERGREKY